MATESIQHGVATPPGSGYEAEVPAAGPAAAADIAEAGVFNDVHYVKEALATRKGGLSDGELNALSHLITQLSTAFSIEQAVAANITSFEQLEKALSALEELLEQVEKAKAEIKEGLKTIIITESLSAALGGMVAAKSFSTAVSQYRYNNFFNKAQSNLRSRSDGGLGAGNTEMTGSQNNVFRAAGDSASVVASGPSIRNLASRSAAPNPSASRDAGAAPPPGGQRPPPGRSEAAPAQRSNDADGAGGPNAANRDSEAPPAQSDGQNAANRDAEAPDTQTQGLVDRLDNPSKWDYRSTIPVKDLRGQKLEDLKTEDVSRLGSYASTNAQKLGYRAEFEMMGARLVQQFAKAFSSLGETQQSIANIDVNADTNVYSNQSEYWSVLMGTYQRLAQEYQTVFQHDLGALGEDASQAANMADRIYRP